MLLNYGPSQQVRYLLTNILKTIKYNIYSKNNPKSLKKAYYKYSMCVIMYEVMVKISYSDKILYILVKIIENELKYLLSSKQ